MKVAEFRLFGRSAMVAFSTTCPVQVIIGGYAAVFLHRIRWFRRASRLYLGRCRMEFWDKDKNA